MKISRLVRTIILGLIACVHCSLSLATTTCPLDHVVFTDRESGRTFVSERVALDLIYRCSHAGRLEIYHFSKHLARLESSPDCKGPFGDTIVQGQFGDRTVFAIYSTEDGAPCCSWNSFAAKDKAIAGKRFVWLTGADVPHVELNDKWDTIQNNPVQDAVTGPLAGGEYAPAACRKGIVKLPGRPHR
jgi:hypothetical protein